MHAYLVTTGGYDEQMIVRVFTDKDLAEQYAMFLNNKAGQPYDYSSEYAYEIDVQEITEEMPEIIEQLTIRWNSGQLVLPEYRGRYYGVKDYPERYTESKALTEKRTEASTPRCAATLHEYGLDGADSPRHGNILYARHYAIVVRGWDHDRVREVFAEQKAQALAKLEEIA